MICTAVSQGMVLPQVCPCRLAVDVLCISLPAGWVTLSALMESLSLSAPEQS